MVNRLRNPVVFHLTGAEAHDLVGADQFLSHMQVGTLIISKAFDAAARVLGPPAVVAKAAVITPGANRTEPRDFDEHTYRARHLIENFFAKLKQYRAFATRYDKLTRSFLAAIHLAGAGIWPN